MKKRQPLKHITDNDRDRIQALRDSWYTQKEIAGVLGFSESTISRELCRNPTRVGKNQVRDIEDFPLVKCLLRTRDLTRSQIALSFLDRSSKLSLSESPVLTGVKSKQTFHLLPERFLRAP